MSLSKYNDFTEYNELDYLNLNAHTVHTLVYKVDKQK